MADIEFRSGAEKYSLETLFLGLDHLNAAMTPYEKEWSKKFSGFGGGSAFNHRDPLLTTYFFWYATSAYNFLTLFADTYVIKPSNPKALRFHLDTEFPELIAWRHKIGAHSSWVFSKDPKTGKNDSTTTRANALLPIVDFEIVSINPPKGRFWVSQTVLKSYDSADVTFDRGESNTNHPHSVPKWGWSLTEQHEKIVSYVRRQL